MEPDGWAVVDLEILCVTVVGGELADEDGILALPVVGPAEHEYDGIFLFLFGGVEVGGPERGEVKGRFGGEPEGECELRRGFLFFLSAEFLAVAEPVPAIAVLAVDIGVAWFGFACSV